MKRVVLVRASGPRNVGMVLRAVANFGPCELALVAPELPSMLVHPEFEQMAHGAEDARDAILRFDSLDEALADCTSSVAFTARVRGNRVREDWRVAAPGLAALAAEPGERLALVFGNEVTGLTGAETDRVQRLVHVRTSEAHTSLNLALCVGIVLAGLFTERGARPREPGGSRLNGAGREFLKTRLKEVLAERVARTPAAARDIAASIERVFSRAPLENRDARAWHLVLKALGSTLTPVELGLRPSERDGRRRDAVERALHPDRPRGDRPDEGD